MKCEGATGFILVVPFDVSRTGHFISFLIK